MFEKTFDKKQESPPANPSAPQKSEDEDYLYRRAEQELELAQAATHPAVVKAHYLLADHYLDSLHAADPSADAED